MLNVIDEDTRDCLCIHVDRRINARKVRRILARLVDEHGAPEHIRSDNGSECIEKELRRWLAEQKIKTIYIEASSPWQNGFVESFNARLRDECLNREWFFTLTEARVVIEDWRWKYNNLRPHRSLGYLTSLKFAQKESPLPNPSTQGLDFLHHLYQSSNTARLTNALAQLG